MDATVVSVKSFIDQMLQNVLAGGRFTDEDLQLVVHRPMPHGFNTYFGDANLDGEFNSSDLVISLAAGTYEQDVDAGWLSGDFDGTGRFDSSE